MGVAHPRAEESWLARTAQAISLLKEAHHRLLPLLERERSLPSERKPQKTHIMRSHIVYLYGYRNRSILYIGIRAVLYYY